MPECVRASLPLAATLSFHLNVLNRAEIRLATSISAAVSDAMSCFSLRSDVWIVPLVA